MVNQRGSAILLALPITVALGVMAGSFMIWYSSHTKLQMRNKAAERATAISVSLKMMFNSRETCRQNLIATGFGTTLADLTRATGVSFVLPDASGTSKGTLLAAGESYEGLRINKVNFSAPRNFFSGETSYIADLIVAYQNPITQTEQSFTMPFYFIADNAGNLTGCLLTGYVPVADILPPGQYPATTDDLICAQAKGADYIYLPLNQTCAPKGAQVSQN